MHRELRFRYIAIFQNIFLRIKLVMKQLTKAVLFSAVGTRPCLRTDENEGEWDTPDIDNCISQSLRELKYKVRYNFVKAYTRGVYRLPYKTPLLYTM